MKKIGALFLIGILVFSAIVAYGQKEPKIKPLPGMKYIKVGNAQIMVPEDAVVRMVGTITTIETAEQYAARKFLQVEERLAKIEAEQEDLEKEIEELKRAIKDIEEIIATEPE